MTCSLSAIVGADILTPDGLLHDHAILHNQGLIRGICSNRDIAIDAQITKLDGGLLAPGLVDLQVNGGGGVMFNNSPTVETLRIMSDTHARIGTTSILPTLITDSPRITSDAIAATVAAMDSGVRGIAGLHLEGPHLSVEYKGAHSAAHIRPMAPSDLQILLEAKAKLPVLKTTVALESTSCQQIQLMAEAGILVSLGHTGASFSDCAAAAQAGARCVTHLFNAQSQLGKREPGTVGAALALGDLSAGMIADTIHVHPASLRIAVHAKAKPGNIFLVSDSMATMGSNITSFQLNGRQINRSGDRLTLVDETLAGAHLELINAVRNTAAIAGLPFEHALAMASIIPADLIVQQQIGRLAVGGRADILHIDADHKLLQVWQCGQPLL